MSFKRSFCFAILLSAACASRAGAQGYLTFPEWIEVGTLGALDHPILPSTYTAFYFFDATHGVAATTLPQIWYISDPSEGAWSIATMPSGFDTIHMIRFIQGKLYAATNGLDALVSTDSGKTWSYSGLNLANANDLYADASGNIRALTAPMVTFARIDTMNCIAVGGGSIFASSDGGLNWTTSLTGIDNASIGAFGDPCFKVFICPSSYGTAALRSTDSGKTWQDVLTGAGPGSEYLVGASSTCYMNDANGMFRSIDDGVTWTSIIAVNYGPHFPMFVWGGMGEQVVMSYYWVIPLHPTPVPVIEPWMTTTGGDGNLHGAVAMTDSNGAPLLQEDTMNVPFHVVSFCNSFLIPIALEADVPGLSISATLTNSSSGDYSLISADSTYFPNVVLGQHFDQDTMWLSYTPHHAVDTALITFTNTWNCSQWTETRSVIVTSIPSAFILPPPVLAGNCQPVTEPAIVELDSCQELIIDSIHAPEGLSARVFIQNLPDTLFAGHDSLPITFDPADTVATISDSVTIFAHFFPSAGLDSTLNYFNFNAYLGDSDFSAFEQTVPLTLIALPSGISLVTTDSAISLHRASFCEQELDTNIAFTNTGCTPDTIFNISLSGTGYMLDGNSVHIIVPPDSTTYFHVLFTPPDTGSYAGVLQLQAVAGNSKSFSIPIAGTGFPHVGMLAAIPSLDFGTTSTCEELDSFVVITDTACDSVCVTAATLSGTGFIVTGNTAFCLAPGGSDTLAIRTNADLTNRSTTNTATLSLLSNATVPLPPITLTRGIQYSGALSAGLQSLDFDTTYICQEVDSFVVITDTACDSVCVTGITISGTGFMVSGNTSFCVAPGERDTIALTTTIDTTNGSTSNSATLTINSDANPPLAPIALSREIAYPVAWTLALSPPVSAPVNSDVVFKITQPTRLPSNVDSLDFAITYNDDLLDFDSAEGVIPIRYYRDANGVAHERFEWNPIGNGSVIATLHFHAYVAPVLETELALDSVTFHSSFDRSVSCLATLSASQSMFTLIPGCGSTDISTLLRSGRIAIDRIDPNPASDEIEITISSPAAGVSGELSIVDALGRRVSTQKVQVNQAGENDVPITLENIASGIYLAQFRTGNFCCSKKFIKE